MNFENKDYYNILGVTKDASFESIQRAYDRARWEEGRYWDINLNEAHSVLSNYNLRREYDNYLKNKELQATVDPITVDPVTVDPATVDPVTVDPATVDPATVDPVTVDPATVDPITVDPATVDPTTVDPITIDPATVDPTTVDPITIDPATVDPTTVDPTTIDPATVDPTTVDPTTVDPTTVDPTTVDPTTVDPATVDPTTVDPAIVDPSTVDPATVDPATEQQTQKRSYDDIYSEKYADATERTRFNPETTPKKEKTSQDSKLKTIGKYVGGTVIGFAVAGPLGAIAVPLWMKHHKKKKLQKGEKPKKISEVKTQEMQIIENYNKQLDDKINELLSTKHNNYRLEICRAKYENQIRLLNALLEVKISTKSKKGAVRSRLEILSIKNQIETAKKRLKKIDEKIAEYNNSESKETNLARLNREIDEVNQKIAHAEAKREFDSIEAGEEIKSTSSSKIRNLKVERKMRKRDKKAKKVKFAVVKSGAFYDKLLGAKDFTKSVIQSFNPKNDEVLDTFVDEELHTRVR